MKHFLVSMFSFLRIRAFSIAFLLCVGCILASLPASAANEENRTVVDGPFSLAGAWGGALNVGSNAEVRAIGVRHEAGTAEGSLVVIPSDTLNFSYTPTNPRAVLNNGIFNNHTLQGEWASSLANRGECPVGSRVFSIGADQYAFVLCGTQPAFSLSSSNNAVMSCSGMVCTASGVGSARITATIAGTPVKTWGEKNSEGWIELVSTTLPATTLAWTVEVVAPPTLTFSMSGTNPIPSGTGTTLSWNAQNAEGGCESSGDWSVAPRGVTGTYDTGDLLARRDYTLTCTGRSGDTVERTVTVLVGSPTMGPSVTLSAGSTLVPINTGTTLTWSSTNAATCAASGDWEGGPGPRPLSGTEDTGNLAVDTSYILTCFDAIGNSQPVMITVRVQGMVSPPSFSDFHANPTSVFSGDSTELIWDVRNATFCTASSSVLTPSWNGNVPVFGRRIILNLTNTVDFDLSCTGVGGTTARSVRVVVLPIGTPAPIINFYADRNNLTYDEGTTLHWQADYASSCSVDRSMGPNGTRAWWDSGVLNTTDNFSTGNLARTTSFRLACENAVGVTVAVVTVNVAEPTNPITLDFTADFYAVDYQGSTRINWNSTNATACVASGSGSGNTWAVGYDGSLTGGSSVRDIRETSVFELTCSNASESVTHMFTITVNAATIPGPGLNPPVIDFRADSSELSFNTATMLRWTVQGADTCTASADPVSGNWSGLKDPVSGSVSTGNLRKEGTNHFDLVCVGPGGRSSSNIRVNVGNASQPGPLLSFWADDFVVPSGGSTTLRWTSTNADGCEAMGDWSGSKGTANIETVGPLMSPQTYWLRCWNVGGSTSLVVNVLIGTSRPMPSVSLWSDELVVPVGGSTLLRWTSSNAVSCRSFSNPPSTEWVPNANVELAGGKSTGALLATQEYTLECIGADGTIVSAMTTVGAGAGSAIMPEITDFLSDGAIISSGTTPTLRLFTRNVDSCCLTNGDPDQCWLGGGNIIPTNGIFNESSGLSALGNISVPATYWAVCRHASSGLEVRRSLSIRVGRILLCPASISRNVIPGGTLQFDAWYTEDSSVNCYSDESARGVRVTVPSGGDSTVWARVSGGVSFSSPGLVFGNSPGSARIRVTHKPAASTTFFSEEADVTVGLPITCHLCNEADFRCSSETQFDVVHDPAECSSGTFSSPASCRFNCHKDRWEEVAP